MHPIIDDPYTAEMVAEIYFEDFLKSRNILEYKEEFHTTVMFDKDTYEWVVVYLPVYETSGTLFGSNEPIILKSTIFPQMGCLFCIMQRKRVV